MPDPSSVQLSKQITPKVLLKEAIGFRGKGPVYWIGLSVCAGALSWVMCMVVGAFGGDVFLLYSIIILYLASFLFSALSFRSSTKTSSAGIVEIVPPCLLVSLVGIILLTYLTTDELNLSGVRVWQNINGPVLLSGEGGALHTAARVLVSFAFLISLSRFLSTLQRVGYEAGARTPGDHETGFNTPAFPVIFLLLGFSLAFVLHFLFLTLFLGLPLRLELDTVFRFASTFPLTVLTACVSASTHDCGKKCDFVIVGLAMSAAIAGIFIFALS